MWIDIACIVFVCVTMNHLGLIKAVETIIRKKIIIVNCPKCCTCWTVFAYELWVVGFSDIPMVLAISFLSSYLAVWLELFEGFIDTLYMRLYEKIYPNDTDVTLTAADFDGDTTGTMS